MSKPVPVSILDLAHVPQGGSARDAFDKSKAIARLADETGYTRLWLAEHHGMRGVASAATAVVLAAIGNETSRIRIGSGGIMLPNHPPLVIAEQFGTLAALFGDRIDLGLGRAPGTDMLTAKALRRDPFSAENYAQDVQQLQQYLDEDSGGAGVIAMPGAGSKVPLWLLGSSLYSAKLAGQLGLPYSFASHFAPEMLFDAITVYRASFRPSAQLDKPHISAGVMAVVGETDEQARMMATSVQQQFANLRRNANKPMPAPVDDIHGILSEVEVRGINHTLQYAAIGDAQTVEATLAKFVEATGVDELILSFPIFDRQACLSAIGAVSKMKSVFARAA